MKRNIENELQALRNAVNSLNLIGYRVHELKGKYLLTDNKGTSLTGYWDYVRLNHFIMGYGKAFNNHYQLLQALKAVKPFIDDLEAENYSEPNAGISYDNDLGLAAELLNEAIKNAE